MKFIQNGSGTYMDEHGQEYEVTGVWYKSTLWQWLKCWFRRCFIKDKRNMT